MGSYGRPDRFGYQFMAEFCDKIENSEGSQVANAVEQAMRNINNAEDSIRNLLDALTNRIELVRDHLQKSRGMNELGEFQGNGGQEIDRYLGIRHNNWQFLAALLTQAELKELQEHVNAPSRPALNRAGSKARR
jgi:hypothetical protein